MINTYQYKNKFIARLGILGSVYRQVFISLVLPPRDSLPSPFPQDIFQHCIKNGVTSVTGIPYFDGDFWPNVIEESIYQENKERELSKYKVCVGSGKGENIQEFRTLADL